MKPDGSYYGGDKHEDWDREVPQRPSILHSWNGKEWVLDEEKQRAQEREAAKADLLTIDTQSIRATRAILLSLLEGQVPNKEDVDILRDRERAATERRSLI